MKGVYSWQLFDSFVGRGWAFGIKEGLEHSFEREGQKINDTGLLLPRKMEDHISF